MAEVKDWRFQNSSQQSSVLEGDSGGTMEFAYKVVHPLYFGGWNDEKSAYKDLLTRRLIAFKEGKDPSYYKLIITK